MAKLSICAQYLQMATLAALVCSQNMAFSQNTQHQPTEATVSQNYFPTSRDALLNVDSASRRIAADLILYINAGLASSSAHQQLPSVYHAFAVIAESSAYSVEIKLSAGAHYWGDKENEALAAIVKRKNIDLAIIGMGHELTHLIQRSDDTSLFRLSTQGASLYVEGVHFAGSANYGSKAQGDVFSAQGGSHLTLVDSRFSGSSSGDGVSVSSFQTVLVSGCIADGNYADGFSYTNASDNGPIPMQVMERHIKTRGNGVNGAANSQGSTIHRHTQIIRVASEYANNPTNIEDTGLNSLNIDLIVKNPTVYQKHANGKVNFLVRGDKLEGDPSGSGTHGIAWIESGQYYEGGVLHAHTTRSILGKPIAGYIRFSERFDVSAHADAMSADEHGQISDWSSDWPNH